MEGSGCRPRCPPPPKCRDQPAVTRSRSHQAPTSTGGARSATTRWSERLRHREVSEHPKTKNNTHKMRIQVCVLLPGSDEKLLQMRNGNYFHSHSPFSRLSPRPALLDARDGQHAVRMEGPEERGAVDADPAVPQEEQRDDKVGGQSVCDSCSCKRLRTSNTPPPPTPQPLVPLQVCRGNGSDRPVVQPVHRLKAERHRVFSSHACVIKMFFNFSSACFSSSATTNLPFIAPHVFSRGIVSPN